MPIFRSNNAKENKKQIWDKIREIHHQRETFKIKVDKDADDPRKRKGKTTKEETKAGTTPAPAATAGGAAPWRAGCRCHC